MSGFLHQCLVPMMFPGLLPVCSFVLPYFGVLDFVSRYIMLFLFYDDPLEACFLMRGRKRGLNLW